MNFDFVVEYSVLPTRNAENSPKGVALVIDDTLSNIQSLSDILTADGFAVLSAPTGEIGLQVAREQKPDIILLDLVLPGILGIEVFEILKSEQPDTAVILSTAFGNEETVVQALRRGVYDYLINKQPVHPDEVREAAHRALMETRLRRENRRLQKELTLANQQLREYSANLERMLAELRIANEKLTELDRTKTSFISIISHELRRPLTISKGYLDLISTNASHLDPETRGFLETAEQHLKLFAKSLDDLVDLSQIESGRYHIDCQVESIAPLVNQTLQAMGLAAQTKGISLKSNLSDTLPFVSADPLRITQVLCNLVDNAIKFTSPGGCITISAAKRPPRPEVEFVVADTGIGIPDTELGKIFDRFYQVRNNTTTSQTGSGLGLAICREIVHLHNGQIWATSAEGKGTQIHFTLSQIEN